MSDVVGSLGALGKLAKAASAIATQVQNSSRIMYMLGPVMFSRDTVSPKTLNRTTDYSWPLQARIGRTGARQFTGINNDTIEVDGTLYPQYGGGTEQITLLRLLAETGEPQIFLNGQGIVYGKWCIVNVEEKSTYLNPNGSAKKIDFTVTLEAYGEDDETLLGSELGGLF